MVKTKVVIKYNQKQFNTGEISNLEMRIQSELNGLLPGDMVLHKTVTFIYVRNVLNLTENKKAALFEQKTNRNLAVT